MTGYDGLAAAYAGFEAPLFAALLQIRGAFLIVSSADDFIILDRETE